MISDASRLECPAARCQDVKGYRTGRRLTLGSSRVMRGASMASPMSSIWYAPIGPGPTEGKETCAGCAQAKHVLSTRLCQPRDSALVAQCTPMTGAQIRLPTLRNVVRCRLRVRLAAGAVTS